MSTSGTRSMLKGACMTAFGTYPCRLLKESRVSAAKQRPTLFTSLSNGVSTAPVPFRPAKRRCNIQQPAEHRGLTMLARVDSFVTSRGLSKGLSHPVVHSAALLPVVSSLLGASELRIRLWRITRRRRTPTKRPRTEGLQAHDFSVHEQRPSKGHGQTLSAQKSEAEDSLNVRFLLFESSSRLQLSRAAESGLCITAKGTLLSIINSLF